MPTRFKCDWLIDRSLPIKHGSVRNGNVGASGDIKGCIPIGIPLLLIRSRISTALTFARRDTAPIFLTGERGLNGYYSLAESLCLVSQDCSKLSQRPLGEKTVQKGATIFSFERPQSFNNNGVSGSLQYGIYSFVRKLFRNISLFPSHSFKFFASGIGLFSLKGRFQELMFSSDAVQFAAANKFAFRGNRPSFNSEVHPNTKLRCLKRGFRDIKRNGEKKFSVTDEKQWVVRFITGKKFCKMWITNKISKYSLTTNGRNGNATIPKTTKSFIKPETKAIFNEGLCFLMFVGFSRMVRRYYVLFTLNHHLGRKFRNFFPYLSVNLMVQFFKRKISSIKLNFGNFVPSLSDRLKRVNKSLRFGTNDFDIQTSHLLHFQKYLHTEFEIVKKFLSGINSRVSFFIFL